MVEIEISAISYEEETKRGEEWSTNRFIGQTLTMCMIVIETCQELGIAVSGYS